MRSARPDALYPEEISFRLDEWVLRNLTLVERSGPEWTVICPACGRSKMSVHVTRKAYQCFSAHCRFRGWHPARLVATTLDLTITDARQLIAALSMGMDIGPIRPLEAPADHWRYANDLPAATMPAVHWGLTGRQLDYAHRRGICDDHIRYFGLGEIRGDGSRSRSDYALSGRIMFPVWNPFGVLVWWVARAIGDSGAKTINMPRSCRAEGHPDDCVCFHAEWGLPPIPSAATADEVVLGLHLVTPGKPVYIVEGPVDAAVCGPGFVAVMRAWISPQQAVLIAESGASEAIILFDGDKAGEIGMKKSLPTLQAALPAKGTICPPGEDPGSLGRTEALRIADLPSLGVSSLPPLRYKTITVPDQPHPYLAPLTLHAGLKITK